MTEPNNYDNIAADTDVDAATAATEEFNYTIGDAIAPEVDATEETVEADVLLSAFAITRSYGGDMRIAPDAESLPLNTPEDLEAFAKSL